MSTVATLDTVMRLDSAAFRQGMVQAANQANASLGSISKQAQQTASVLLQMKRAAETFGSFYLVKEGVASLIDAQKQLQAIDYTLIAATGSGAQAQQAFGFLREESQRLGLVLPTAAQGFANLSASATAAGVSMSDQMELFDAYARASTTLHLSTDQSNRALLALEQMFAKGKIQAQELRLQLGQAIPGAAQRFQNAVMEMTKGTDLAGKSFDQLLQAGALTTSRFLPALVQAISESGRGVEQAAEGLNAQLNRVQTAWFDLKTEMSDGLFTDAATEGAKLLASNLDHVATTLGVIAGLGLARVTGSALQSGAGRAVSYNQQNITGPQMAAAAERDYAAALATSTKEAALRAEQAALLNVVTLDSAKAALADAQQQAFEAAAIRDAAVAEVTRVKTLTALNEALGVKVKAQMGAVTLTEQETVAAEALAVAEAQLAKARTSAIAASNAVGAAEARTASLRAATITATEAATVAENALVVAQERVAATGLASVFAGAAKSFGTFAMGLVGGPWGLAIAGIGAVGYAIYSLRKQAEEFQKQTDDQVKSLQDLRQQLLATAEAYGTLHNSQTLTQSLDVFKSGGDQLAKQKAQLAGLQSQAEELRKTIAAANTSGGLGSGAFGAAVASQARDKLALVTQAIADLQAQVGPTEDVLGSLSTKIGSSMVPQVDALRGALDRLKAGASLKDILGGMNADFDAGVKNVEAIRAKVQSGLSEMKAQADALTKAAATEGKNNVDKMQYVLDQVVAGIKKSGLTAADTAKQIADATAEAQPALAAARQKDAADAAKKAATEAAAAARAQAEANADLTHSQNGQLQGLQEQLAGTAKFSSAQRTLNEMLAGGSSEFRKLSAAQQADALARQRRIVVLTDEVAVQQAAVTGAKRLADLQRELGEEARRRAQTNARSLEGIGHGDVWNSQQQALEALADAYAKMRDAEDKDYQQKVATATVTGSLAQVQSVLDEDHAAALGKIILAQAQATAAQRQYYADLAREQGDWMLGVSAALEDYNDKAINVAGSVKEATASAFSAMEDSLVSFVTTGKLNFRSFAVSVLSDLARIAMRVAASQALQAIVGAVAGSYGAGGSNTFGSVGTDSSGGSINFVSQVGGRASGGPTSPNSLYRVAENGHPELYSEGGKTYLMTGARGGMVSNGSESAGGGAGGPVTLNYSSVINIASDGGATSSMTDDAKNAAGSAVMKQLKAVVQSEVLRMSQPGGFIYNNFRRVTA